MKNVAARSAQLEQGLRAIFEDVEIHVKGVAASVKLGDEDGVEKLGKKCRDRGLIIVGEEDEVMLLPRATSRRRPSTRRSRSSRGAASSLRA